MSEFLQRIIPSSNRLEAGFSSLNGAAKTALVESCYEQGFVGAFLVGGRNESSVESAGWVKRAGEYLRDEFHAEASGPKFLSDIILAATGDGECHQNHVHSLNLWQESARASVEPYDCNQDYGSCVDASLSEMLTAVLGYRIAVLKKREVWQHPAAWYAYSLRGYCSDGWNAWGAASAIKKLGVAFRMAYDIGGQRVDLTDDDTNEQIMARTWCRSGPPQWLRAYTSSNHPIDGNAVVEFNGGAAELKKAFANGGVLHFSGTRVSGGSKPFTPGSTGAHQMPAYGYDDSEEGKRWFRDKCGVSLGNDFAVHCGNTWGTNWRGECADQYWPPHWGPKTSGSWICSASWFLRNLSQDMVYLPESFPGFPGDPLPPTPNDPKWSGAVYAEQLPSGLIAIRGEVECDGKKAIIVPDGSGRYRPVPKPVV